MKIPEIPKLNVPNMDMVSARIPKYNPALIKSPAISIAEAGYASEFYKYLAQQIIQLDQELDKDHEVGIRLVSFGQTVVFHVRKLGYQNPHLIFFYGETDKGEFVQLIQHVSQISFLLMAVRRPEPEKPKRPIGFMHNEDK